MANNFMMKLLLLFFGFLPYYGSVAQISKKPDVTSSAVLPGGFQPTTLLTSIINEVDIILHDIKDHNARSELDADANSLDMNDAEVLTDTEEGDDDELDVVDDFNSGDLAISSTADLEAGKGVKARLLRYKKTDCEKKRGGGKGKKMKEGKCHTLHKKHFQSYQFSVGEKKNKKKEKHEDPDDDDYLSKACRIIVYHDGKCKNEASTANEGSCEDMVDVEDDDDDDKKLHSRDLMGKPKTGKYKSAKFLCDGVDVSKNTSSSKSVSNYYSVTTEYYTATSSHHYPTSDRYTVTSLSLGHANATRSSPKSFANSTLSSSRSTRVWPSTVSVEPTTTTLPDEEDEEEDPDENDKEDLYERDEEENKDIEDNLAESQATKTRKKHRSKSHKKTKGTKKHPDKTESVVTPTTQPEQIETNI